VEIGRVLANRQVAAAPGSASRPVSAPLLSTVQCAGAVTVMSNGALRSGCSKQVNTRRASAGSYCVYRYVSPSSGSWKWCSPSPVRL
jgi:hypothetical protein